MMYLKEQIRAFIVESFLFGDTTRALSDDDSLIENDVVDSTGILELVSFVEHTFALTEPAVEILPTNFDSIARVAAFVAGKSAVSAPLAVAS